MTELRCIHRHTISEHPACFAKGLIKGIWTDEKEFVKATGLPWYTYPGYKMGFLDIESDGLKTDFGTMLSWAIMDMDGTFHYDKINKGELFELEDEADRRLVQSLVDVLSEYKIIVTYFGLGFDIPFVRTKALHYDIPFPKYGELFSFDLYYLVRAKLNLSRKSLENVCDYLGIDGKTPLRKSTWRKAKYGNSKALAEVLFHNIADCDITRQLYNKLIDQAKWTRRSI